MIDLNADVGEGMDDAALMPFITSANVACGGHAGDAASIERVVSLARAHGVRVGAHPSYPDQPGFGRVAMSMALDALERSIREQVARVPGIVHVKAHGALYHRTAESRDDAGALLRAVDASLVIVGPPGAVLLELARAEGRKVAVEAFADRRYRGGKLVPRSEPDALITDPAEAAAQAVRLAATAQTICVHSDTPNAAAIARAVRKALESC